MSGISWTGQTFAPGDLIGVSILVVLEALLSADNAIVLALLVKHLGPDERKKALTYGLFGAFGFRLIATIFAAQALRLWPLQAAGAAYLVYLGVKHLFVGEGDKEAKAKARSFWATVAVVELTDIAFALDSILAGVSFVGKHHDKLWVVYVGAVIGIVLLRLAATALTAVLDKYPVLDKVAYALVGWVGLKLAFLAAHSASQATALFHASEMPPAVFWSGMAFIGAFGAAYAYRSRRHGPWGEFEGAAASELEAGGEAVEPVPQRVPSASNGARDDERRT